MRYSNYLKSTLIICILSLFSINTHALRKIGLDHEEIYFWEYWRVDNGTYHHEAIILNPTQQDAHYEIVGNSTINKKYSFNIKGGDYQIISNFDNLIKEVPRGLITFTRDDRNIGLYNIYPMGSTYPLGWLPKAIFKKGILSNRILNTGQPQEFILHYKKRNFKKKRMQKAYISFEKKFIDGGFRHKQYYLNETTDYNLTKHFGIKISAHKDYSLYFKPISRQGQINLLFRLPTYERSQLVNRTLSYTRKVKNRGALEILIPRGINFCDKYKIISL